MVIAAIDQGDADVGRCQFARGREAAETAAENDDMRHDDPAVVGIAQCKPANNQQTEKDRANGAKYRDALPCIKLFT